MQIDSTLLLQLLVTRWLCLIMAIFIVGEPVKFLFPRVYAWYSDYKFKKNYQFIPINLSNKTWFPGFWIVLYVAIAAYHSYNYYSFLGESSLISISTGILVSAGVVGLVRYYGKARNVYALSTYSVITILLAVVLIHFFEPAMLRFFLPRI